MMVKLSPMKFSLKPALIYDRYAINDRRWELRGKTRFFIFEQVGFDRLMLSGLDGKGKPKQVLIPCVEMLPSLPYRLLVPQALVDVLRDVEMDCEMYVFYNEERKQLVTFEVGKRFEITNRFNGIHPLQGVEWIPRDMR